MKGLKRKAWYYTLEERNHWSYTVWTRCGWHYVGALHLKGMFHVQHRKLGFAKYHFMKLIGRLDK